MAAAGDRAMSPASARILAPAAGPMHWTSIRLELLARTAAFMAVS